GSKLGVGIGAGAVNGGGRRIRNTERQAGLQCDDTGNNPVAERSFSQRIGALQLRQFVQVAGDEPMLAIEIGRASVVRVPVVEVSHVITAADSASAQPGCNVVDGLS